MKKYLFYISILSVFLLVGCYDDEISYSKPGEPISPVTNLTATASGEDIVLNWDLPTSYPDDVIQPVFVQITVSIDGTRQGGTIELEDNATSYTYTPEEATADYRFTVKVMADIETTEEHESDLRYSPGETVEF